MLIMSINVSDMARRLRFVVGLQLKFFFIIIIIMIMITLLLCGKAVYLLVRICLFFVGVYVYK